MPTRSAILLNILFVIALICSGCRTLIHTDADKYTEDDGMLIAHDQHALSEALANFSIGLILDGMSDDKALVYYAAAVEIDPESLPAYLGITSYYIRRGELDKAAEVMEDCCRKNPTSSKARIYLSQIYQSLKRLDDAERASLDALEIDSRDNTAYFRLSSIYGERGDRVREIAILEESISKVDNILPVLRHLGDLHTRAIHTSEPEQAMEHLGQAIFFYNEAAQHPFDSLTPVYLHRLGDLYIMKRDINKAVEVLDRLSAYMPADLQIHKKLALCHMALNNKDSAIRSLEKVVKNEPDNAEVYCYLGELYETMDDIDNAAKYYSLASEVSTGKPLPYLQLARLYLKTDPEKAAKALRDGLDKLPGNTELIELLSRVYLMAGQDDEAIRVFDSLIEIVASSGQTLLNAGHFLDFGLAAQRCGMIEKADSFYRIGIEMDPELTPLYQMLASLLMSRDMDSEAIVVMQQAIAVQPDDPDSHYYLALILHNTRRFDEAASAFSHIESLARQQPGISLNAAFFFHYGAALERIGNTEKAETMLIRSIALNPNNAEALNYLAYMWAEQGRNLQIALEYVAHALDIDPHNGAYIDTLGWIHYMKGNYTLALDHIENALYFMPGDPTIAEHLGDILHAQNRREEAKEWWIYSFRSDPSNEAVAEKLKNAGVMLETLLPYE